MVALYLVQLRAQQFFPFKIYREDHKILNVGHETLMSTPVGDIYYPLAAIGYGQSVYQI